MTATPATVGPRRAIWGLVNDGYALVAKTANLTHDEAFELCRVPDIGDPSAYLDHGVAYLHAPKWGHVFARYFTNYRQLFQKTPRQAPTITSNGTF